MWTDPITRETVVYATRIFCDKSPQTVIAFNPDNDKQLVLILDPLLRATPTLFESKQVLLQQAFTAQQAATFYKNELTVFCSRVLFTKHSDSTLTLFGETIF